MCVGALYMNIHVWECACVHVFGSQRTSHTLLFCFSPYSLETKCLLVPGIWCFTCTGCPPNPKDSPVSDSHSTGGIALYTGSQVWICFFFFSSWNWIFRSGICNHHSYFLSYSSSPAECFLNSYLYLLNSLHFVLFIWILIDFPLDKRTPFSFPSIVLSTRL